MKLGRLLLCILCCWGSSFGAASSWAALMRVTDTDSLTHALSHAKAGDTVVLASGVYQGNFRLTQSIALQGEAGAIVDAMGQGSALTLSAANIQVHDLTLRNWGRDLYYQNAGILLQQGADEADIRGNQLSGDGFGIYGEQITAPRIHDNRISGNRRLYVLDRGDGIYLKQVTAPEVTANHIQAVRDGVYLETVSGSRIVDNQFTQLQYGIHYMYTSGDEAWHNHAVAVDGGYALMSSKAIYLHHNHVEQARDFGILLNVTESCHIQANVARQVHNPKGTVELGNEGKGLFIYGAQHNQIEANEFSQSDTGISMAMGGEQNRLWHNHILANQTQVKYVGEAQLEWSHEGEGNYWSQYAGWDRNADGIGDIAYRPNDSLDKLFWLYPEAKLLMDSPVVQLLRWVERQYQPLQASGVIDSFPLMRPLAFPPIDGASQ